MHNKFHSLFSRFTKIIWATLLFQGLALTPTHAQDNDPLIIPRQRPVLTNQRGITVVVKPETGNWEQVSQALPITGYTAINLEQLNETVLSSARVVFLANVQDLSETQVQLLEMWVNRGGRLIVAGNLGQNASLGLRNRLRSLLGGLWAGDLTETGKLFIRSGEVYNWRQAVPNLSETNIANAGKLQQNSRDARIIAYWGGNDVAILARPNVYYLGWNWGINPAQQAFDRSWFLALVNAPNNTLIAAPAPAPTDNRPISNSEAREMVQELQDLVGRVESAMLSGGGDRINGNAEDALYQTRQVIQNLPQMITAGRFAEARQTWEQTRLNLWQNYPIENFTAKSEVRAIWLDRGTIVAAGSEERLAQLFDRMASVGVNTVFVETVNAGYTIYPSRVAPQQNPLIRGWDPLAVSIRLARQRKMEIHAWVWVFAAGNGRHNPLVGKPEQYPGPVLERFPQWANLSREGSPIAPEGKMFLDPANPEVQEYLLRLYREMVTTYDLDGLHIDYIRYPRQDPGRDMGFGRAGRAQFSELTGVDPLTITSQNRSLWWMWTEMRVRRVNQFVTRLAKEMRRLKPKLILSAAVFPFSLDYRINRIQQNWETWVARGELDLLTPMTYVPDTGVFLRQKVQPSLQAMGRSPVLFLPGVLIRNVEELELLDQLQAVRDLPSGGFALFATEHLRPSVETALMRTRIDDSARIIPFRQPFMSAKVRYRALQQEWKSLLEGKSALVKDTDLTNWQRQSQQLDATLTALAERPSRDRLETAIRQADSLGNDLKRWLRSAESYRVVTWVNRLQAITTILRFGEFRMLSGSLDVAGK